MQILKTVQEARAFRGTVTGRLGLVPTMGALHAGHLSHLGAAKAAADAVVVSIFVNPTQFGPNEDFDRYPRTVEVDLAKCATAGADAVFVPSVDEMYPTEMPAAKVDVPGVAEGLEGGERPGHFEGVCRVVMKLLNITRCDVATFGRKDYQQLCVVRSMVEDLMLPVEIVEIPTTREDDGLAMSSRNRYLDEESRKRALGLSKALRLAEKMVADGESEPEAIESAMRDAMQAHHVEVDYAAVRRQRVLAKVDEVRAGEAVALVAGRIGGVRLLDNLELEG